MGSHKMDETVDALLNKIQGIGLTAMTYAAGETEWSSLHQLENWLDNLDKKAPAGSHLKGIAYEKTFNHSLGLPQQDFTVFMPWRTWAGAEQKDNRDFPSPLQRAFREVLQSGKSDTPHPIIDLASLQPHREFFLESGKGQNENSLCLADELADFVNKIPADRNPIIRFLIGDDNSNTRAKAWSGDKATLFTDIFWKNEDGKRVRRVTHANATLYVGYYNPNFAPKPADAKALADFIGNVKGTTSKHVPELTALLSGIEPEKIVNELVKHPLRAITWNHGKVLAVNGKVVMTGGGNYWREYNSRQDSNGKRIDHDIVDHQAIVVGDAAVSAHQWADYFWRYLAEPSASDDSSGWWSVKLGDESPNWIEQFGQKGTEAEHTLPPNVLNTPFKHEVSNQHGKIPVLTVGKLGDWHGMMKTITHPVLIVDASRDIMLNALWQLNSHRSDKPSEGLGFFIYVVNLLLSDPIQAEALSGISGRVVNFALHMSGYTTFNDLKISPVAWASRSTRTLAIAGAKKSVIICQQMLVDYFPARDKTYQQNLVAMINARLGPDQQANKWDGCIWPFDLLIAVGEALWTIYNDKTVAQPDEKRGVYLVQTTKVNGDRQDWEDQTSIDRIKHRLRRIMLGLPGYETSQGSIDAAMKNFYVRRVLEDNGTMYSHSKIVCVDHKLMYVGSDNAYPCYNEEHGVWVEEPVKVGAWVKDFFLPYWDKCSNGKDPGPENEYFADNPYLTYNWSTRKYEKPEQFFRAMT